jgi:hypothetical protein
MAEKAETTPRAAECGKRAWMNESIQPPRQVCHALDRRIRQGSRLQYLRDFSGICSAFAHPGVLSCNLNLGPQALFHETEVDEWRGDHDICQCNTAQSWARTVPLVKMQQQRQ